MRLRCPGSAFCSSNGKGKICQEWCCIKNLYFPNHYICTAYLVTFFELKIRMLQRSFPFKITAAVWATLCLVSYSFDKSFRLGDLDFLFWSHPLHMLNQALTTRKGFGCSGTPQQHNKFGRPRSGKSRANTKGGNGLTARLFPPPPPSDSRRSGWIVN